MKKGIKYAILSGITIAVLALTVIMLSFQYNIKTAFGLACLPTVFTLLIGISIIERKDIKGLEGFEGCGNQIINIYGPSGSCNTPESAPVTKEEVQKWISSLDSSLTKECKDCISSSILKMWKKSDLLHIQGMYIPKQKAVLNAMLIMDCKNQCVIPTPGLSKIEVSKWVQSIGSDLSSSCQNCAVEKIMALWSPADYSKAITLPLPEQQTVLQGVLATNCGSNCNVNKISLGDVQLWLNKILSGAMPECYACMVDTIINLWDTSKFNQVKSMSIVSQRQVVQALMSISCEKECITVPSGISTQEAQAWILSILDGSSAQCVNCLVSAVVKNWTKTIFAGVKDKTKEEQTNILRALLAMNCSEICYADNSTLTSAEVIDWVNKLMSISNQDCKACIVNACVKMWNKSQFNEVMLKPVEDQLKLAMTIAQFNCSDKCDNIANCDWTT